MEKINIFKEIDCALHTLEKPSDFFNKLKDTDNFKNSSFKVLGELVNIPQEPKYHPEGNVWEHLCMVIDAASIAKEFTLDKREFMWGALFHDIGKITTTVKRRGRWTSYNHDIEGYNMVKDLLIKETGNYDFTDKVAELVRFHMHHIYILKNLPFGKIDELLKTNSINDIILLFACDKLGRGEQTMEDKERVFEEVFRILDILEEKSGLKYAETRKNLIKFKGRIISK